MSDEQHEKRLNAMKFRILKAEHENLKNPLSKEEMIDKILKIIRDEANKIYGGSQNVD